MFHFTELLQFEVKHLETQKPNLERERGRDVSDDDDVRNWRTLIVPSVRVISIE